MNLRVSKSRCISRCFHSHGVKLNFRLAFGLFTAVAMLFTSPARAADEKSVLVLSQGNGRQPSIIEFTSGFQLALATNFPGTVVVYIENLDLQQFNSPDYRREIAEWLRVKYQGRKLDAIVAENEQTADTAFKIRTALSPQTPLVFLNFDRMDVPGAASQTNMTGILASPKANPNIANNLADVGGKMDQANAATQNGLADLVAHHTAWIEQLKAIGLTLLLAVIGTAVIACIVKFTIGLRPTEEEESQGLDLANHGEEGYVD